MRHDEVATTLRELAFDFFYWFSRFEFALKENGYLMTTVPGARAEPDWNRFVVEHQDHYAPSQAAGALIAANPLRQIIGEDGGLTFGEVPFATNATKLRRVVGLAKTVRNNLFHGGKHGSGDWDDPDRMTELLRVTTTVLADLARLGELEADYTRLY